MSVRAGLLLAGVVGLSTALSGCAGFTDETPLSILDAARRDLADVSAVHMVTESHDDGVTETRDLVVTRDGDCEGTVTTDGAAVKVLRTQGFSWIQPDENYWPLVFGGPLVSSFAGKWVQLEGSELLDRFCDIDDPFAAFVGDPRALTLENVGEDVVDGTDVVRVRGVDDAGAVVDVAVAADEPHVVLEMTLSGTDRGHAAFSEFGQDPEVQPPPAVDVVQVDDLR